MASDTVIKFEFPVGLDPVFNEFRKLYDEDTQEMDPDLVALLPFLHEGPTEMTAQEAEILAERLALARLIALTMLDLREPIVTNTFEEALNALGQVTKNIARALWSQAYSREAKQQLVDQAWRHGFDMEEAAAALINTYGAPEAEVRGLLAMVGA